MQNDLYIRFGDIPENEQSNKKQNFTTIGKEDGVSCYNVTELNDKYVPIIPIPCTEDTLCTIDYCLLESSKGERPVFLISGDLVGRGIEGEPLLRNITIVKDISYEYIGIYEE